MVRMRRPLGLLLDLDGTVYFRGRTISGAIESIAALRARGIGLRFLSNTDSLCARSLAERVRQFGIGLSPEEVFTAGSAALHLVKERPGARVLALVSSDLREHFAPYAAEGATAEWVVVGDCRDGLSYERLNGAFRALRAGARLIALQRGRYFYDAAGVNLDTGAIVAALEYAAETTAVVAGKPSAEFFDRAIDDLRIDRERVWVVGDDATADVAGAREAGLTSVLVRTGKYEAQRGDPLQGLADATVASIRDLETLIDECPD